MSCYVYLPAKSDLLHKQLCNNSNNSNTENINLYYGAWPDGKENVERWITAYKYCSLKTLKDIIVSMEIFILAPI